MDPKDAIHKIETEFAETCGAIGKLIVTNAARNAGIDKTKIASKAEFLTLLDSLVEPATKFLGKTKADESIRRWKTMV